MSDNGGWFFDLALVIAATGALTLGMFLGLNGVFRIAVAIPLILFLPGYALVSILFPRKPNADSRPFDEEKSGLGTSKLPSGGLEATERIVLSVVFSVALVPAVTLFASVTPMGISAEPIIIGLSVLTVLLALLAINARGRCLPEDRYTPSFSVPLFFSRPPTSAYDRTNTRPYNIAIVIGLVLLLASGGYAIANPPQDDGFTEFSVQTENITNVDQGETIYDSTLTTGEPHELQATITNQEHGERTYTVVVQLQQVSYTDGDVAINQSDELDRQSVTIPDGESREQTFQLSPTIQGNDLRLVLLLYEGEPPADPSVENAYRVIRLPVDVQ